MTRVKDSEDASIEYLELFKLDILRILAAVAC